MGEMAKVIEQVLSDRSVVHNVLIPNVLHGDLERGQVVIGCVDERAANAIAAAINAGGCFVETSR